MPNTPRLLVERTAVADVLERRDRSISNLLLVVALIGAGMLLPVLGRGLRPASPLVSEFSSPVQGISSVGHGLQAAVAAFLHVRVS